MGLVREGRCSLSAGRLWAKPWRAHTEQVWEAIRARVVACWPFLYRHGARGHTLFSAGGEEGQGRADWDLKQQSVAGIVTGCAAEVGALAVHIVAAALWGTSCRLTGFSRQLQGKNINYFCHWLCKYRIWEAHSRDSLNCLCSLFLRPSQHTD